jgi:hypothetical protein
MLLEKLNTIKIQIRVKYAAPAEKYISISLELLFGGLVVIHLLWM